MELDNSNATEFRLIVSDSGIGIPRAAQPYVFGRFYRVDQVPAREEGSSGLGLSIVKQIIEAHGGSVSVKSDIGKGIGHELDHAKPKLLTTSPAPTDSSASPDFCS